MGKSSSLLALIVLHSNKLDTIFKKTQAVSLPLTTQNEIASSFFYLTSYIVEIFLKLLEIVSV